MFLLGRSYGRATASPRQPLHNSPPGAEGQLRPTQPARSVFPLKPKFVPYGGGKNKKPALERAWEGDNPFSWCRGWESIPRPRAYEPKIGFFKIPSKRPSYEYYLLDVYDKVLWNFLKSYCQHLLTIVYQTFTLFSETAKRLS